jgi:chromosome partitioning protein
MRWPAIPDSQAAREKQGSAFPAGHPGGHSNKDLNMIITCDNCKKRYNLDVSSINRPSIKVRCAHCNHCFIVRRESAVAQEPVVSDTGRSSDRHVVFAISNQKGGVAKTSTCLNLGMSLVHLGKKVLLIDFDVQANLTTTLGFSSRSRSFFDILYSGSESIADYIHATRFPGLHLLPSNSRMALLTKYYMYRPGFETLLRNRLPQVADQYDFILIDTPPAIGFCTLNALMAADHVLIPTPCEYLSMHGIHKIEDIIQFVRKKSKRPIDYHILISVHNRHSTSSEVIYRKIRDMFGSRVLNTVIEHDEKLKESQIVKLPVMEYNRTCPSARQFLQLARELAGAASGNALQQD